MHDNEIWITLFKDKNIPKFCGCNKIIDDDNGLALFFICEENKVVKVIFNKIVYSYRKTVEVACSQTILYMQDNFKASCAEGYWIYEVKNSYYSKWLEEESLGVYVANEIKHFAFGTENEFIDVLSSYYPEIVVEE